MNLKNNSTELSKINAKIDNFARMGTAAMADQRKLLENMDNRIFALAAAFAPPATNEIEAMRREFTALQASLMEKIAEQKQSYENQLAETRAKTEQALSGLKNENEALRSEMAAQKLFYETQLMSLKNENESMRLALTGTEQALVSQRTEIEKIRDDFGAFEATLTTKITELIDGSPAYGGILSELKYKVDKLTFNDDLKEDYLLIVCRKIHKAFDECPYFEKTQEKFNQVYERYKRDFNETPLICKRTQDMVEEITKSKKFQNLCKHDSNFLILNRGASIISTQQQKGVNGYNTSPVSEDYIKLILALLEYV